MSRPRSITSYFYERKCYLCERRTVYPENPPVPKRTPRRVTFTFAEPRKMLKSASPQYSSRSGSDIKVIRLTADQEAVLQEQFNRWPRAPHTADVVLLAAETGLSEADVEACPEIAQLEANSRETPTSPARASRLPPSELLLDMPGIMAWYAIRLAQWRKEQGLGGNLGLH